MDDLDRKSFYIALLVMFFVMYIFAGIVSAKMTTCRLASQVLINKQRVCVYVGANNTQYREYLPYDAGNCPRDYQCPYRPNEEPFDTHNEINMNAKFHKTSNIPKLFINAEPGFLLVGTQRDEVRAWANLKEVKVKGNHFIQEDSPEEITAYIKEFISES